MADRRTRRDIHALNEDGMVLCNPRDREAAHRAEHEGIATEVVADVTCRKCLDRLPPETRREQRQTQPRPESVPGPDRSPRPRPPC